MLNRPPRTQPGGNTGHDRRPRQYDTPVAAAAIPHQVDWTAPIRCRRPRQPQLRGPLTKLDRRFRQAVHVDTEERVERLDLDIEPLHERNRHRPQIREAAADRDLHDGITLRTDSREKLGQLVYEPGGKILPPCEAFRVLRHGRSRKSIFIAPRQLARAEQRAVANECDARNGCIQGDVRLDRARDGKRLSRSRQPEKRVGGCDDRSNADVGLDERPDRRRHIIRVGQREHHRLPGCAFDRRRRRRDIGDRPRGVHSRRPCRHQSFSTHLFVRAF